MAASESGVPSVVVYLGGDAGLAAGLRSHLAGQGAGLVACTRAADAAGALNGAKTGLLLMDGRSVAGPGRGPLDLSASLRELSREGSRPRWIGLVDNGDLAGRLAALRGGALACYANLPPEGELAERICGLLGVGPVSAYRVLVVDDQEVAALSVGGVLNRAGMVVRTVFDAMTVLDAIDEFRPDLILTNLHMQGATGIELTAIIREHDDFFDVPIVFVSGEADRERQLDAFRAGADEFLLKPVDPKRLVQTVRARIEQARSLRNRHVGAGRIDTATGLWSRGHLLARIDRAIVEGAADDPGQAVLYIEIDPSAGLDALRQSGTLDAVVARVGQILRGATDPKDLIARIGESSLAVLARRDSAARLATCAEALRQAVTGTAMSIGGVSLELTASLGIGLFQPPPDDAITLVSRAKAACIRDATAAGDDAASDVAASPAKAGSVRALRLEQHIREALSGDGLKLVYQAVVSVQQDPRERYEALLRLRTPDGELIPPLDFLPVAVEAGLMPDIDRWVMTRVLDDIMAARDEQTGLVMLVRQTFATAASADWVVWVRREIVRRNLVHQPPVLIFDLDDVAAHQDVAKVCLPALKRLGIATCLNHYDGSPRATEILGQFPWSLVRLSRRILRRMDLAALADVVKVVHDAGAQAIGVEIEDPQAIARVWDCGVDYIQGNFVKAASEMLDFDFAGTELL